MRREVSLQIRGQGNEPSLKSRERGWKFHYLELESTMHLAWVFT